jgi:cephalosporin hydroxylase
VVGRGQVSHKPAEQLSRQDAIDDSAHRYDTTLATLRRFADLVPLGSYVLVEDGHRDYPGMLPAGVPHQAPGVVNAIRDWLSTEGAGRFIQKRSQARYIVTSNPGGWLRRVG